MNIKYSKVCMAKFWKLHIWKYLVSLIILPKQQGNVLFFNNILLTLKIIKMLFDVTLLLRLFFYYIYYSQFLFPLMSKRIVVSFCMLQLETIFLCHLMHARVLFRRGTHCQGLSQQRISSYL